MKEVKKKGLINILPHFGKKKTRRSKSHPVNTKKVLSLLLLSLLLLLLLLLSLLLLLLLLLLRKVENYGLADIFLQEPHIHDKVSTPLLPRLLFHFKLTYYSTTKGYSKESSSKEVVLLEG